MLLSVLLHDPVCTPAFELAGLGLQRETNHPGPICRDLRWLICVTRASCVLLRGPFCLQAGARWGGVTHSPWGPLGGAKMQTQILPVETQVQFRILLQFSSVHERELPDFFATQLLPYGQEIKYQI